MRRILDWMGANPLEVTITLEVKQTLKIPVRGVIVAGICTMLLGILLVVLDVFAESRQEVRAPPAHATPTPSPRVVGWGDGSAVYTGVERRPFAIEVDLGVHGR